MTAKEALLNLVTLMRDEYNFPFNLTTEYKVLKQSLTELEELKRDVKRYFDLQYKNQFVSMTQNEIHDMYVLREKLMKVGAKDV